MGHIYTAIRLSNPERTRVKEVEAVADIDATLTVTPQRIAQELELRQFTKETVETGTGEIKLQRAAARMSINGRESVQDVLVSDISRPCPGWCR